jgi:hypothetical protein
MPPPSTPVRTRISPPAWRAALADQVVGGALHRQRAQHREGRLGKLAAHVGARARRALAAGAAQLREVHPRQRLGRLAAREVD